MSRNALTTSFNGKDYVFFTNNTRKVKSDSQKVANVMGTLGINAPSEYWHDKTMLVEVDDAKVLGGKTFRDFKEVRGTYQGSFTPYEGNYREFDISRVKKNSTGHVKDF